MGMFDYLKCEYKLVDLPQRVIDAWDGAENIAFQTKDTPNWMDLSKVWVQKKQQPANVLRVTRFLLQKQKK